MNGRCLIACIGNIFFADDGFGVEVARRLADVELPPQVTVADYGIRGVHLAYDLLDGYDVVILVDALDHGDEPGTISILDVTAAGDQIVAHPRQFDPHGMAPDAVLEHVTALGGSVGQVYVIGCQPTRTDEGIGLSSAVSAAVPSAVDSVVEIVNAHYPEASTTPAHNRVVPVAGTTQQQEV